MKFWIIYILVQISFFGGTALGRFSQCFFFTFSSSTNQGDRHFFSENPLEFVGLTLYSWKFHTKQSFTPGNSTKSCYTTWLGLFQKKSKQGKSWGNFHILFFLSTSTPHLPHHVWICSGIAPLPRSSVSS